MSTPDTETRPAADDRAAGQARHSLRASSCADHRASVLKASVLLVSELVTDAVRHGVPPVTLALRCDESTGLEIQVSDGSLHRPALQGPSADDLGGRGVVLVDALSEAWGVVPTETGKVVWCRLRAA